MSYEFKEIKKLKDLSLKVSKITKYLNEVECPTYKDFLFYSEITSQDFSLLYSFLIEGDKNAKKIYYTLEKIKMKFEINMEKMLLYQNHSKGNYNYRLLRELYLDSVNSPISVEFKNIELSGDVFNRGVGNNNNKIVLSKNESDVNIFSLGRANDNV